MAPLSIANGTGQDVELIRSRIADLRTEKRLVNLIPRDDVFALLEQFCKVLYYPIKDSALWAFYRLVKREDERLSPFVFINTSQPLERQIFAAAHELAHVLQVADGNDETLISSSLGEPVRKEDEAGCPKKKSEVMANRFAAELLMDKDFVKDAFRLGPRRGTDSSAETRLLLLVIELMDSCIAPYKMTVKRLHELELIEDSQKTALLEIPCEGTESPLVRLQNRFGLCSRNQEVSSTKRFDEFIDMALQDFAQGKISLMKLTQVLSRFDKTPESFGIDSHPRYPTAEELQRELEDD
jgi:Zn-dependent peptidase ImmA (M78 family)